MPSGKVIRTVEGWANDQTGSPRTNYPSIGETVFAKLGSRVSGGFEWTENHRYLSNSGGADAIWTSLSGGRRGSNSDTPKCLAVELIKGGNVTGQDVVLRWTPTEVQGAGSDPSTIKLEWVIISPISTTRYGKLTALWVPGHTYVVLQPVADATGNPFPTPVPDPVNVSILFPAVAPGYLRGEVNDIFCYEDLGSGSLLLKNPQTTPLPTRKWEVMQNMGVSTSAPQWVADYMRAHDLAP